MISRVYVVFTLCAITYASSYSVHFTREQISRIAAVLAAVGVEIEENYTAACKAGMPVICNTAQINLLNTIGNQLAILQGAIRERTENVESRVDRTEELISAREVLFESKLDELEGGIIVLESSVDDVAELISLQDVMLCSKISALDDLVIQTAQIVGQQCIIAVDTIHDGVDKAREQDISDIFDTISPFAGIISRLVQAL